MTAALRFSTVVVAVAFVGLGAGCASGHTRAAATSAAGDAKARFLPPRWLLADERRRLSGLAGRKLSVVTMVHQPFAVVIVRYDRVVVCNGCIAPGRDVPPRGDTVRITYNLPRRDAVGLAFCGGKGSARPRAFCLRRWGS